MVLSFQAPHSKRSGREAGISLRIRHASEFRVSSASQPSFGVVRLEATPKLIPGPGSKENRHALEIGPNSLDEITIPSAAKFRQDSLALVISWSCWTNRFQKPRSR